MIWLAAILAPFLYIGFALFRTLLIVIGWFVIGLLSLFHKQTTVMRESYYFKGRIFRAWKWWWMFPWGNEEEGVEAGRNYKDHKSIAAQIFYWCAVRNPTNNLRFVPYLSCAVDPKKVKWWGNREGEPVETYDMGHKTFWYFCSHGIYSNFRVQFISGGKLRRFWIGWKVYPHDSKGLKADDYRKHGAGFATQFKVIDKDENAEYR